MLGRNRALELLKGRKEFKVDFFHPFEKNRAFDGFGFSNKDVEIPVSNMAEKKGGEIRQSLAITFMNCRIESFEIREGNRHIFLMNVVTTQDRFGDPFSKLPKIIGFSVVLCQGSIDH